MKFQDFRNQLKEVTNVSTIEEGFKDEAEKLLDTVLQVTKNSKILFQKIPFLEKEKQLIICISLNPMSDSDNENSDTQSERFDNYQSYKLNVTFGRCNGEEYELFDNYEFDDPKLYFNSKIFLKDERDERYEEESDELNGAFQKYQQVWIESYLPSVFKKLGFETNITKSGYSNIEFCSIMLSVVIDFQSLLDF